MSDMQERMGSAIGQALAGEEEMVTKWVAIVETINGDGERAIWTLAPDDAKPWDTLGMLAFGVQKEQAASVYEGLGDDEGDDRA